MSSHDHDPTDDLVRAAAERFQTDVSDAVDVGAAYSQVHRPRRSPATIALTLLAVFGIAAAVLVVRGGDDVEIAFDEEDFTEPDGSESLALGAADDGKDSVRLPVGVDPIAGLVDGQVVTVTGSGFPANESVGAVMCTKEAAEEFGGRGIEACNIAHYGQGTSDANGNVVLEFEVRRFQVLDGQEIDCASEEARCLVGLGMISDYDQSGGIAVDFDPDAPLPPPASATLSKSSGLQDGEVVGLSVTGLQPDSYLSVNLCDAELDVCTWVGETNADGQGAYQGDVHVWRSFGVFTGQGVEATPNLDCLAETCVLSINADTADHRPVPSIPLAFDDGASTRDAPVIQVLDAGPFSPGDRFDARVTGLDPSAWVDLSICAPDAMCVAMGQAAADAGGVADVEVRVEGSWTGEGCPDGCRLRGHVTSQDYSGNETRLDITPPMFPAPVVVEIVP